MNKTVMLLVVLIWGLSFFETKAQKKFKAEITFSADFDLSKLQYSFDNGTEQYKYIKPEIKANKVTFTGEFSGKYATLWLSYPTEKETKNYYSAFWVDEKPANIVISQTDPSFHSPLLAKSIKNALEVKYEGAESIEEFISTESNDFEAFYSKHGLSYKKNDSLAFIYYQKYAAKTKKQIEYLRQKPSDYFAIWYFNKEVAVSPALPKDSLIQYFNEIFTDTTFKFEKNRGLQLIKTKPILRNTLAPIFKINDIEGKELNLGKMRGKSVLLVYWASWCVPCIAEIPTLKKVRKMFSEDQLEIISITKDETYPPYQRALDKYKMDWKHVYGNEEIVEMYNVTGIPEVFLIDINGYLKYSKYGFDVRKSDEFISIVKEYIEK